MGLTKKSTCHRGPRAAIQLTKHNSGFRVKHGMTLRLILDFLVSPRLYSVSTIFL